MFSEAASTFTLMFSEGSVQVCAGSCNLFLVLMLSEGSSVFVASTFLSVWHPCPARALEGWRRSSLDSREASEMSPSSVLAWSDSELDNCVGAANTRSSGPNTQSVLASFCSTGVASTWGAYIQNRVARTLPLGPFGSEGEGLTSSRHLFPHSHRHSTHSSHPYPYPFHDLWIASADNVGRYVPSHHIRST